MGLPESVCMCIGIYHMVISLPSWLILTIREMQNMLFWGIILKQGVEILHNEPMKSQISPKEMKNYSILYFILHISYAKQKSA